MTRQIEAVYENGVLRPLAPLPLMEHERVTVTITLDSAPPQRSHVDPVYLEEARRDTLGMERIPTLDEVREMVSKDKTSWAAAVISQREDRF